MVESNKSSLELVPRNRLGIIVIDFVEAGFDREALLSQVLADPLEDAPFPLHCVECALGIEVLLLALKYLIKLEIVQLISCFFELKNLADGSFVLLRE